MKSRLFRKDEVSEFVNLANDEDVKRAKVRGPLKTWTIKGQVVAGPFTSINGPLNARGRVYIGKYCAFGQHVGLISSNHRTDMPNQQLWFNERHGFKIPVSSKGPIDVGHNVWIGDKATVLSGVSIGHGAVVAAGAIVTNDVAPFSIVGGNPAREIMQRCPQDVIDLLLKLELWHWDDDKISRNRAFFETSLTHMTKRKLKKLVKD